MFHKLNSILILFSTVVSEGCFTSLKARALHPRLVNKGGWRCHAQGQQFPEELQPNCQVFRAGRNLAEPSEAGNHVA